MALEQPRLGLDERENTPHSQWLYSQANLLIHHLIGNGRILDRNGWRELFQRAGCAPVQVESMGYLGYDLFAFALGADL